MAVVNPNAFAKRFVMRKAATHIRSYRYKLCTLLDKLGMIDCEFCYPVKMQSFLSLRHNSLKINL
jgi:hypothetical protein